MLANHLLRIWLSAVVRTSDREALLNTGMHAFVIADSQLVFRSEHCLVATANAPSLLFA